ncbi:MAG: hypothetical protein HOK62_00095, partial [Verrucomicrobiales bacterium]|nr:hypothetical protein [Verrucomicrobiales bacterium]
LYNLETDPAEKTNLRDKHPDIVKELAAQLATAIRNGRTNPGPNQSNEGWPATFHKSVTDQFPALAAPSK